MVEIGGYEREAKVFKENISPSFYPNINIKRV